MVLPMDDVTVELRPTTPTTDEDRHRQLADPGFGRYFTDHVVRCVYGPDGWEQPVLEGLSPISLHPAASVLHYGQAVFEGMKAYRQRDGSIAMFRPLENARRFATSARRLAMPELPEAVFLASLEALVRQDAAWVPTERGHSLYLRPVMIATEPALGVRPANQYLFYVLASPAGNYFSGGVRPVTVWLSTEYVRAVRGGTGEAKFAGNYAGSLLGQAEAKAKGCDQVVWLDALEHRYVEEMGGMNIAFVMRDGDRTTIVTPELSGSLLPGITRKSLLALATELGYGVEERRVSRDEWVSAIDEGRMTEAFACGTAAIVTPIGAMKWAGGERTIGGGEVGRVTLGLRKALLDIQLGAVEDRHGWIHRVDAPPS
jgi:branched-chain amino acid aminotransferase